MEEIFEIFDENNQLIGRAPRSEVHAKGFFHRGVDLFLMNSQGKVFLHKRSETKDICPGHWGMSMGEHLKPGESFREAAIRGLEEELGVGKAKLTELRGPKLLAFNYEDGKIDKEFDALFLAETDQEMIMDPEEIAEGRFFTREEIEQDIRTGARKFTPCFLAEWSTFRKHIPDSQDSRKGTG